MLRQSPQPTRRYSTQHIVGQMLTIVSALAPRTPLNVSRLQVFRTFRHAYKIAQHQHWCGSSGTFSLEGTPRLGLIPLAPQVCGDVFDLHNEAHRLLHGIDHGGERDTAPDRLSRRWRAAQVNPGSTYIRVQRRKRCEARLRVSLW